MKKSILILEDAIFVREMEKKILKESGYQVVAETNSQKEGIALYKEHNPDLVLVDLQLADGTGVEAMKAICQFNPEVRFVIITSHSAMLEDSKQELAPFILGILSKPFAAKDLQELLDHA